MSNKIWLDNNIQFPRLLAEIMATQSNIDFKALSESMDLSEDDILEIFNRAQDTWEGVKSTQLSNDNVNEQNTEEVKFLMEDVFDYLMERDEHIGTNFLEHFNKSFIDANGDVILVGENSAKYRLSMSLIGGESEVSLSVGNVESISEISESVYFAVVDHLGEDAKYIEPDPDNEGGTRNTECGSNLYFLIESVIEQSMTEVNSGKSIAVTLNSFDDEGNVVDTTVMQLTENQVSDIVDHAAQLIIVDRDNGDVNAVINELEEALCVSGVIAEAGQENEPKNYTVWVGGVEVNEVLLTKTAAENLAKQYRDDGYDDVQIESVVGDVCGAECVIRYQSDDTKGNVYISFGQHKPDENTDEFGVNDDHIFFYAFEGLEQLKSLMKENENGFVVVSYNLAYTKK